MLHKLLYISRKELVHAKTIFDILNHVPRIAEIRRQTVHQGDKNRFHVHVLLAFLRTSIKQLWKSVDVKLLREALNHAVQ